MVCSAVWMPAYEGAVVSGTALLFLLCVAIQRRNLCCYDQFIGKIQTADDTNVRLSLFREFMQVGKLALPTLWCKEFAATVIFILLFVVKSILRVGLSNVNGRVMSAVMEGTREERIFNFTRMLLLRTSVSMMAAICSGCVEHLRSWLIGCYRVRLSRCFQRRFYTHLVHYQATMLDTRLESVDTVISTYCGEFAEHFAELPYYFLLPMLEGIISMIALTKHVGGSAASVACGSVATSVFLLQLLSPAFGKIRACILSREDNYRRTLTNALNDAESIAIHDGSRYVRHKLEMHLSSLKYGLDYFALARGHFAFLETAFSGLLHVISSLVVFVGSYREGKKKTLNDMYVQLQYMQDLNDSVKNLVVNFREISHLATFTAKLAEFDTTLASIAQGTFIRATDVAPIPDTSLPTPRNLPHIHYTKHPEQAKSFTLFAFSNLKLTTPSGKLLFTNLNLSMESNQDWVVVGENGCGKTSFLRMISGLWFPTEGQCSVDRQVKLLFAPQHSYMVPQCSLLDQILFPQPAATATEKDLACFEQAIELSGAHSVVDVLGGFHSQYVGINPENTCDTYDWNSLSGGQKQRISMARVFYHVLRMDRRHKTPVAILDEATSMMDETEQLVFRNLRKLDVRMLSVTHRDEVVNYHTHKLQILPGGNWTVTLVNSHIDISTGP